MREILFKAKALKNKQWVEGYYCKMQETTYAFAEDYEKYPVPTHHYIVMEKMTDWGLPNKLALVEIDPETLCQYIGRKDVNKKKIFDGDILLVGEEKWEVMYDNDNCMYVLLNNGIICDFPSVVLFGCEVVGNIHDKEE